MRELRIPWPRGGRPGRWPRARVARSAVAASLLAAAACTAQAAPPLPLLGLDPARTTLSGLSSGGFMAVQMHVAYSATFAAGAGIVAGGPFHCAEGSFALAVGRCMAHAAPIPVAGLVATTRRWADAGSIDPVANLARSKVYLYSGTADDTVRRPVVDALLAYYGSFLPATRIVYRNDVPSGHAMITDGPGAGCAASAPPFIDDCGFDLAGAMLGHLYGALAPRNDGAPSGTLAEFDQSVYVRGHGMAAGGWLYVPRARAAGGARCRLHAAFPGCRQNAAAVGGQFVRHAGYNRWADTNALVVLYPQTGAAAPNGCWDWWGYDSADYAVKNGPQMAAVKAMVDALVDSAAPASSTARGATTGTPPAAASPSSAAACFTSSNYEHTAAGRAHVGFGLALANGSNQNMGLWNVFVTTTLKRIAPDRYVIGGCG